MYCMQYFTDQYNDMTEATVAVYDRQNSSSVQSAILPTTRGRGRANRTEATGQYY